MMRMVKSQERLRINLMALNKRALNQVLGLVDYALEHALAFENGGTASPYLGTFVLPVPETGGVPCESFLDASRAGGPRRRYSAGSGPVRARPIGRTENAIRFYRCSAAGNRYERRLGGSSV